MSNTIRYEYRLSFLQVFLNPIGMLVFRGFSIGVFGFCVYLSIQYGVGSYVIWILPATLMILSLSGLLYGYGRWTREPIWVEFTDNGVRTNYGGLEAGSDDKGIPYKFLRVQAGLSGTIIVKALSGHFIIIPTSVISGERIDSLVRDGVHK